MSKSKEPKTDVDAASVDHIVMRLRGPHPTSKVMPSHPIHPDYVYAICAEAAEMLEFFFGQMQMHSPYMGGQHSYRFRSGGWPMTHCKGPNAEDAVKAAIQEIKRERDKSA